MKEITFPLQVGLWGEGKEGKSYFAASFVKEFTGMIIEPVSIQQMPPKKGSPARYVIDQSPYGHSAYALKNLKIDYKTQYRHVKSWDEYNKAIDELSLMAMTSDKRVWLVIDDTDQWRRLYSYHLAFDINGRTQVTKDEYMQAGGDLVTEMNRLKNMFNIVYVNQAKDEFVKEVATGRRVAAVYPSNAKFVYEIYGKLYRNFETKTRDFDIELLTTADMFDPNLSMEIGKSSVATVKDVSPRKLLMAANVEEDLW